MAHFFDFAILRLESRDGRDERINVGVAVFLEGGIDVRLTKRLERIRVFSAAIDVSDIRALLDGLPRLDDQLRAQGIEAVEDRAHHLGMAGPLSLSSLGNFSATDQTYEARIGSIMRNLVEPEPAPIRIREKRSRLLTQLKRQFKDERVLAQRGEDLGSHRIVSNFELDEGLVADLVLRNGAMHVVETVDASADQESLRRALGEIGISALVLERARMKFGQKQTRTKLVYAASSSIETMARPSLEAAQHQGAELVNWSSHNDRVKFIHQLSSVANPIPYKRSRRGRSSAADVPRFA